MSAHELVKDQYKQRSSTPSTTTTFRYPLVVEINRCADIAKLEIELKREFRLPPAMIAALEQHGYIYDVKTDQVSLEPEPPTITRAPLDI